MRLDKLSLQPTSDNAECFRLSHVVVDGPKGCLLLVGFSYDIWSGSWESKGCPNLCLWETPMHIHNTSYHAHARMCLFGSLNDAGLNFGSRAPKTKQKLVPLIAISCVNDKQPNI